MYGTEFIVIVVAAT